MIQMSVLHSHFKGRNLLMEPKLMISPKGRAATSVMQKSFKVDSKPSSSCCVTCQNMVFPLVYVVLYLLSASLMSTIWYFLASLSRVPSFIKPAISSLVLAAMSEPLRKAMPYSSASSLML